MGQHFLDLGNCPGGIQVFGTGLGAVHNCVAFENGVGIVHLFQTLGLKFKVSLIYLIFFGVIKAF